MDNRLVEIGKIKVNNAEKFDCELVEKLAESIEIVGLLNPIVLTSDLELVAGRHRLEAYKSMEFESIPASIVTLDEMQRQIAKIDEDLIRKHLTSLEQCEQLSARKKIYEMLYPQTRRGVAGAFAKHNGATDILSFAADTASKTGESERNINRKIALYDRLPREVRELIKESAIANNCSELIRLGDYDFETQIEFAELIQAGKAKNVGEANKLVNESFRFSNTDKGKFQKSVKRAEKALKQLVDDGIVETLVERISEENYVFFKDEVITDLESLKNLQVRIQEAIRIFENGIRNIEANTFIVHAEGHELALAE